MELKGIFVYSPTLRLLAVLELLQTYGSMSGKELADRLEVDIRTIRRYVTSLQDMGIPVAAERGPVGAYRLQRGSRLPPMIFNDSEASAIVLGLSAMKQMNYPIDAMAIETALAKTKRVLPEQLFNYISELEELIKVHNPAYLLTTQIDHSEFVWVFEHAIKKRKSCLITYWSKNAQRSKREVNIYGMTLIAGQWYIAGYCHLRKDIRTFRMDRVLSVTRTENEFKRPRDFDVLNHVLSSRAQVQTSYCVEIVLETTIENARHLLPTEIHSLSKIEGGVLYNQSTTRLDWLAFTLLNLNVPFKIIQPTQLYKVFTDLSEKAARIVKY